MKKYLALSIICLLLTMPQISFASEIFYLDNGMEFLLIPRKGTPMIAGSFIVGAGLADENEAVNGASHLLEHLLFNGTEQLTQAELYDQIDFLGGYFNAHTTEEYTNFIVLLEKDNFGKGLNLLDQMLFSSRLDSTQLTKEIGIVEQEIAQSYNNKSYAAGLFARRIHNVGTPYSRPVLGSKLSLSHLSQNMLWGYYKSRYVPNNISAVIIGDFDPAQLKVQLAKTFGAHAPSPARPSVAVISKNNSPQTGIFYSHLDSKRHFVQLSWQAPAYGHPDFYRFSLLCDILSSGERNFWQQELLEIPYVVDVSTNYRPAPGAASFTINITANLNLKLTDLQQKVSKAMNKALVSYVDDYDLKAHFLEKRIEEIYNTEKLHYYGMYKAELLGLGGAKLLLSYESQLQRVNKKRLIKMAKSYFKPLDIAKEQYSDEFPGPIVTSTGPLYRTQTPAAAASSENRRLILANGLSVNINYQPDCQVFAISLLARDRARFEPVGQVGIADLLHRTLLYGAGGMSQAKISTKLKQYGAHIKVTDNHNIPYDDYYFSAKYSYIRLKTIGKYAEPVLELLSELVFDPKLSRKDIEKVQKKALNIINAKKESSFESAMRIYKKELLGPKYPFLSPPYGVASNVAQITQDNLEEFHRNYFDPQNLILSIVSDQKPEQVMAILEDHFGQKSRSNIRFKPYKYPNTMLKTVTYVDKGYKQASIFLGKVFALDSSYGPNQGAALSMLGNLLSKELAFTLREEQGLAYSVGASVSVVGTQAILSTYIGVDPEKAAAVEKELLRLCAEFSSTRFDPEQIRRILNRNSGRKLMRSMTAENRAFNNALNMLERTASRSKERSLEERAAELTPEYLQKLARRYLGVENHVLVVVK